MGEGFKNQITNAVLDFTGDDETNMQTLRNTRRWSVFCRVVVVVVVGCFLSPNLAGFMRLCYHQQVFWVCLSKS